MVGQDFWCAIWPCAVWQQHPRSKTVSAASPRPAFDSACVCDWGRLTFPHCVQTGVGMDANLISRIRKRENGPATFYNIFQELS